MTEFWRRVLTGNDWLGLALIGAFAHMCYITLLLKGYFATDLSAFYAAGLAIANGTPDIMYDTVPTGLVIGTPERIQSLMADAGLPIDQTPPYLYPPIWAYLLAPLTRVLSIHTFFDVMMGVQSFMLAMMPWIGYRIARPRALKAPIWLLCGFFLLFVSTTNLTAVAQNQLQITVTFITMLGLLALTRGKSKTAGVLIGVAAALKIAPAAFGLLLLIRRDWRALAAMAVTGLGLLAISLMFGGLPLHLTMLERLQDINAATILSRANLSPEMVLYELRRVVLSIPPNVTRMGTSAVFDAPAWIQILPKLCFLGALIWIVIVHLRHHTTVGLEALVLSLAVALFGPLSWMHYFVLPLALTPVLFTVFTPRTSWRWVIAGGFLTSVTLTVRLSDLNQDVMWSPMPGTGYYLALFVTLLIHAAVMPRCKTANGEISAISAT